MPLGKHISGCLCPTHSLFCSHPHGTDHSLCSSKHSPGSALLQEISQHLINAPPNPPSSYLL